jgi:hypothetical protein
MGSAAALARMPDCPDHVKDRGERENVGRAPGMPVNAAPSSTPAATGCIVEFVAMFVASHSADLERACAAVY